MATASRTRPAPGALREGFNAKARRVLPALAVIVGVPLVLWLIYRPSYVNFDARYALLWARDIVHGHTPDYTVAFAPTPHPLQTLVAFPVLLAGDSSAKVMVALTLLSLGFLTWFIYRLGAELWHPAVGIVAAAIVATRPTLDRFALIGYQDLAFAALVVWALLLETRKPKRGVSVLIVLSVAGLMRPDAWLLSLLYVAYLWKDEQPNQRLKLLALALSAPILWVAQDWIITGQPFHSLHGTKTLAGEVNRRRPPLSIPKRTAWYFKLLLLWPLALGVPLGLAFAWLYARKRFALLVATAAILTAWIVLTSIIGLSLIQRYLVTPGALLAVVAGLAVFGWLKLRPQQHRQLWTALGLLSLALSFVYIPAQIDKLQSIKSTMKREARNYADLKLVGNAPAVRAKFQQCGTISTIGHKAVPDLRYWLDGKPRSIDLVEGSKTKVGPLMLEPRATKQMWGFDRTHFAKVKPPPGYTRVYENHSWVVYASPNGCTGGRLAAPPGGDVQADSA
jgi:hypothetical protein